MTGTDADDDVPLAPAAMLALARDQQGDVQRRLARAVPWIIGAWGLAWLIGFGLLWSVDGAPQLGVSAPVAGAGFGAFMVAALILSAVLGARSGRGIKSTPERDFTGAVFGISASAGFVAVWVFAAGLVQNGMPAELGAIYFPTAFALIVGLFYAVAGGIWHTPLTIVLGGWIVVVGLAAPFLGYPHHYVVFSLAGGGGFLVAAVVLGLYTHRTQIATDGSRKRAATDRSGRR